MSQAKVLFSWSSGKDSALALYELQKGRQHQVMALLTTLTQDYDRVSMHGVRRELLEAQAASLGLPLEPVLISKDASNQEYETRMEQALRKYKDLGVEAVVFGDIFLEDVRRYRQENLAKIGLQAVFPLWGRDTRELSRTLLDCGFQAVVTCVDTTTLGRQFAGRVVDAAFLADLPAAVDPCGENGEYHSFVFGGPLFRKPVPYRIGEKVLRENRFFYCDLVPDPLSPAGFEK